MDEDTKARELRRLPSWFDLSPISREQIIVLLPLISVRSGGLR